VSRRLARKARSLFRPRRQKRELHEPYWVRWARSRAVFQILGILGVFLAGASILIQANELRSARIYKAWDVINSAQGIRASSGRIQALEDLNSMGIEIFGFEIVKRQSLVGVDLRGAMLQGIDLSGADLTGAQLDSADFSNGVLNDVNFTRCTMVKTQMNWADLERARFRYSILPRARIWNTNFNSLV